MTDRFGPRSHSTGPHGWFPSTALVTLAVLSLAMTVLAGTVFSDAVADALATATYALLSAGVIARVVECTLGGTLADVLIRGRTEGRAVLEMLLREGASRYRRLATDSRRSSGRSPGHRERMHRRVERTTARLASADVQVSGRLLATEIRRGVGVTLLLTLVGGILLIAWWRYDPTVVTSVAFYVGWTLTLAVFAGVYLALASRTG